MAALLTDENFPLPVIHALRALDHDVHTLHDYGHSGQALPDLEVLALATAQQRALLTLNRRDFIRLHLQKLTPASLSARSTLTLSAKPSGWPPPLPRSRY